MFLSTRDREDAELQRRFSRYLYTGNNYHERCNMLAIIDSPGSLQSRNDDIGSHGDGGPLRLVKQSM